MIDCQEVICVETNHGVSRVYATCLLSCDVQVLSIERVDGNGEGQKGPCKMDQEWWMMDMEAKEWTMNG